MGAAAADFDGNLVAKGFPRFEQPGIAYIMGLDAMSTTWTLRGAVVPDDGYSGDSFGSVVALRDNLLVVGAPVHDDDWTALPGDGLTRGAAYVFELHDDGTSYTQVAKLEPFAPYYHGFGHSVAISDAGDRIAVGSPGEEWVQFDGEQYFEAPPYANAGGWVYLFEADEEGWIELGRVSGSGVHQTLSLDEFGYPTEWGAGFGAGVSFVGEGDMLASGPFEVREVAEEPEANWAQGAIYIFGDEGTTYTENVRYVPPEAYPLMSFANQNGGLDSAGAIFAASDFEPGGREKSRSETPDRLWVHPR